MLIMNTPHDIECVSLCFILLHVDTGGQTRSHFSPDVLSKKKNPRYQFMALKKLYLLCKNDGQFTKGTYFSQTIKKNAGLNKMHVI